MPDQIEQLRGAGFSDDEIGQWSTGVRSQLTQAGFNDDEVSAYLGGGVPAPTKVPQPFLDRLTQGTALKSLWSHLESGEEKAEKNSYIPGPNTFLEGARQGFDTGPMHIFSESFENDLRAAGVIPDPQSGRAGPLRFMNEAMLRPVGNLFDMLGRATSAGISGAAETIGETVKRLGGQKTTQEAAKREVQNFANYAMAQGAATGGHVAGVGHDLVGRPIDLPLGSVPKTEDFSAAAKSMVGDGADTPFQQKLRQLYEDKGLHPAEVAHHAASDVTVTQALASRGADLPERYHGEAPPETPPVAAKREEPLPAPTPPAAAEAIPAPPPRALEPAPALPADIPHNIRSFSPDDLTVDANRFQFKGGGDEAGVTERLQDIATWDPIKAGLSLVWEDGDGRRFIVDGHQRLGLAKRIAEQDPQQDPRLNATIVRQVDGVSDTEARVMAASKNMAEGTGTAIDAAKILRDSPELVKELPPRSELVRQARSLAELADEPFRMVINDVVPPNYGAIVGRLAPGNPDLQSALIDLLTKTRPANATQAEAIVRQGISAGTRGETQAPLFGDEQITSSLYLDRAKVLDRALQELKRDRLVFSTIARDRDIIEAVGNRLESSANANRAAADAQAVQILQVLANRHGPLSDALGAAARRAAGGDAAGAARDFVDAVREQAESGDLVRAADGLERGRSDAGAKNAANLVDPAGIEPRPGAESRATESANAVIKQAVSPTPSPLAERQPDLEFGPETGAISWAPLPPKTPLDTARESILDKLSVSEPGPRRKMTFSRLYTNMVDHLYPLSEVSGDIATADNPYRLSRLLSGLGGRIDHFVRHGTVDWSTYAINGKSLQQVLDPVKNDLDNFRAFAVSARVLELEARGIQTGFDVGAARQVVRAGIGKYDSVLEDLVGYQNRVAAYLRDSGVLSREGYDAMTRLNQLYVPLQVIMGDGDGFHGAGQTLQAKNPINRIKGSERDRIDPIESVIRNTAALVTQAEKNEVGRALIDTLLREDELGYAPRKAIAAVETPADAALDAALRNYLTAHGVAEPEGVLDLLKAAAEAPPEVGTVSVFRDGVRSTYKVDPEIAMAMKGLDRDSAGIIERVLSPFTKTLRAGAVLSPEFGLRHPIRDFFYAAVTGKFSPLDMARGYVGLIAKSDEYWDWMRSGGGNASMVSMDRRYLQEDIEKLTQQTGLMTRTFNTVFDPKSTWLDRASAIPGLPFKAAQRYVLRPLQVFTELAENASHLGKFIQEERRVTAETGAPLTKPELLEAGFRSRDIAVDASRIGAKMRAWNMMSAFSNIVIQDSDRWIRAFREDPITTSIKIASYITIPQTLLWLYQHDDPRYNEIPAWQRVLTIPILTDKWEDVGPAGQYGPPSPGTPYRVENGRMQVNNGAIFRLPQPWGMGVIFGAGAVATLEAFTQHDPKGLVEVLRGLGEVSVPSLLPTGAAPLFEQFANRTVFTGRTLVPDRMEKWLPEYQYTPYTTEAAKALGKLFGAFPGLRQASVDPSIPGAGGVARALSSPILIENYIRGWTGGLGVYALDVADYALRKEGILPDPSKPTSTLADIPFVKAFTIRYPSALAESIQEFDDRYNTNRVYYDTWMAKAKEGDEVAAQSIYKAGGPRMFVQLDEIKKTLSEHNKLIQDIYKDPKSSPSDKRQLIDTIYYRMIELGQAGKAALDRVDSSLPKTVH